MRIIAENVAVTTEDGMNKFLKHCYWAIRYGDWDMGWDKDWLTKPDHEWFYCGHVYYDGHHAAIRIGKFFIGVSY